MKTQMNCLNGVASHQGLHCLGKVTLDNLPSQIHYIKPEDIIKA